MNFEDFMLTVVISVIFGFILGYFLRDLASSTRRLYMTYIRKPKHLVKYYFDEKGRSEK